ncbi:MULTISPECIES: FAD-binding oxidoreductase [unclassified Synechococcus]|uniref:NAD(P)/FAD-dependent oxidoreductase n=1 Tax=unclassified Synechococcus TaxID=2626047 RepID=UPI0020CE98B4|nr:MULTISPECIES: FAD-binding oxidoreductase [unclassified Synechococcus]
MLVIGAGLAGSLVALALADRGAAVELLDPGQGCSATNLSYGGVPWWAGAPGPMDQLMASAPAAWRHLEQRHGPLGWSPCSLRLHWSDAETEAAAAAGEVAFANSGLDQTLARVEALARRHLGADQVERLEASPASGGRRVLRLDYGRIDSRQLSLTLPQALERAGVRRRWGRCEPLQAGKLPASQVVLAAGAGCRALWPALPDRLRVSWAGVLQLDDGSLSRELLNTSALTQPNDILMPLFAQRQGLEQRADQIERPEWVVDAGLAPCGEGLLLGQTSLIRPGTACGASPQAASLELGLRQALGRIDPRLGQVPASFHQVPVSFSSSGSPLAGPVAGAAGLWLFAGLSSPFALAPGLAGVLAEALSGDPGALERLPGATEEANPGWD